MLSIIMINIAQTLAVVILQQKRARDGEIYISTFFEYGPPRVELVQE